MFVPRNPVDCRTADKVESCKVKKVTWGEVECWGLQEGENLSILGVNV